MRVLVSCQGCKRKYDATKLEIGSRFRCLCGKLLTVRTPRGHESAVIRCSSCGSPREQGVNKCSFCSADFTIHEQDLNTVCPECLTRVSDKARYCAQCGIQLSAELVAGETSQAHCPACSEEVTLVSRQLSASRVDALECPHCGGLWLGTAGFTTVRDQIAQQSSHVHLAGLESPRLKIPNQLNQVRYRKCIICQNLMHRRQYGSGSGVIIDTCREHGIWFDDGELQQILQWIRLGGHSDRPLESEQARKSPSPEQVRQAEWLVRRSSSSPSRDFLDNVLDGLLTQFGSLFD